MHSAGALDIVPSAWLLRRPPATGRSGKRTSAAANLLIGVTTMMPTDPVARVPLCLVAAHATVYGLRRASLQMATAGHLAIAPSAPFRLYLRLLRSRPPSTSAACFGGSMRGFGEDDRQQSFWRQACSSTCLTSKGCSTRDWLSGVGQAAVSSTRDRSSGPPRRSSGAVATSAAALCSRHRRKSFAPTTTTRALTARPTAVARSITSGLAMTCSQSSRQGHHRQPTGSTRSSWEAPRGSARCQEVLRPFSRPAGAAPTSSARRTALSSKSTASARRRPAGVLGGKEEPRYVSRTMRGIRLLRAAGASAALHGCRSRGCLRRHLAAPTARLALPALAAASVRRGPFPGALVQ